MGRCFEEQEEGKGKRDSYMRERHDTSPARRKLASTAALVDSWETANCLPTRRHRGKPLPDREGQSDDPRMQRATAGDRIDCGMGPTRLTNQWRAKEWEGRVSPDSPPRPSYINDLAPHDILLPSSYLSPSASTHNKSPGHLHYNNSLSDTYL
jgi:hypothetical protein